MKLLFLLFIIILCLPVVVIKGLQRFRPQINLPLYAYYHHVFVLSVMLSQWVMIPLYLLQQMAIGFIVFSLCYVICVVAQWQKLRHIMGFLMLATSLFLLILCFNFA